jgi:hypothetical protein
MKFAIALALLALILGASSTSVASGPLTASELLVNCKVSETGVDNMRAGLCLGFLEGWLQVTIGSTVVLNEAPAPIQVFRVSAPAPISVGQLSRVFILYMSKHPEKEGHEAATVLKDASWDAKLFRLVLQ